MPLAKSSRSTTRPSAAHRSVLATPQPVIPPPITSKSKSCPESQSFSSVSGVPRIAKSIRNLTAGFGYRAFGTLTSFGTSNEPISEDTMQPYRCGRSRSIASAVGKHCCLRVWPPAHIDVATGHGLPACLKPL